MQACKVERHDGGDKRHLVGVTDRQKNWKIAFARTFLDDGVVLVVVFHFQRYPLWQGHHVVDVVMVSCFGSSVDFQPESLRLACGWHQI